MTAVSRPARAVPELRSASKSNVPHAGSAEHWTLPPRSCVRIGRPGSAAACAVRASLLALLPPPPLLFLCVALREVVQRAVLNGAALPPGFHSDRELVLEVRVGRSCRSFLPSFLPSPIQSSQSTSLRRSHALSFAELHMNTVTHAIPSGALSEAVRLDGMALELASKELRDDEEAGLRWSRGLGSARITSESRW